MSHRKTPIAETEIIDRLDASFARQQHAEMRRVISIGYPTVRIDTEDGPPRLTWWSDEKGDRLYTAWCDALEDGDDAKADDASSAVFAHQDAIIATTLDRLRTHGKVTDLAELIDAAAATGSASLPDSAAGAFLARVAELAMRAIKEMRS